MLLRPGLFYSLYIGQIDAWVLHHRDLVPFRVAWSIIDQSERARALRFQSIRGQENFARGSATMRTILAEYLLLQPEAVRFEKGSNGKPLLSGKEHLHFNWSHSGEYWVLAISYTSPVGIDIEKIQAGFDWRSPASIAFHLHELQYCEQDASLAERRFFELWTRKEAVFKGLSTGLNDKVALTTLVDGGGVLRSCVRMLNGTCWQIYPIEVPNGYAAAVAVSLPPAARQAHMNRLPNQDNFNASTLPLQIKVHSSFTFRPPDRPLEKARRP